MKGIIQTMLSYGLPVVIIYMIYPHVKHFWTVKAGKNDKNLETKVIATMIAIGTLVFFLSSLVFAYLFLLL